MNWITSLLSAFGLVASITLSVAEIERSKADAAAAYCYAALAEDAQPAPQPKQTLRVLVFGSESCGGCLVMKRDFNAALPPQGWKIGTGADADLEYVDATRDPQRAAKYSARRYPTTVIVDAAGVQVAWIEGQMTAKFFLEWCAGKGKTVSK